MPGTMFILISLIHITCYFKQLLSETRRFFDQFSTHKAELFLFCSSPAVSKPPTSHIFKLVQAACQLLHFSVQVQPLEAFK